MQLRSQLLAAFGIIMAWSITAAGADQIIVKLRPALAEEMELSLDSSATELVRPTSTVKAWCQQYQVLQAQPVYVAKVRERKQTGHTYEQMAGTSRQKFPRRAVRSAIAGKPAAIGRTYRLTVTSAAPGETERLLQALQSDPLVEFAQRDQVRRACLTPNDPYFSSFGSWGQPFDDLYGLKNMHCGTAWDTNTGTGIIVAVVDTGIDYTHPDIAGNVWINPGEIAGNGIDDDHNGYVDDVRGWDFIGTYYGDPSPDNDPLDAFHGHGTHVAGTIAAVGNNALGVIGVAFGARVMAVKGLDDYGYGLDSDLAQAITYAADNGADVINASWGETGDSPVLADAISYATGLGVVFVAAAGNNNDDVSGFCPANVAGAISVSAVDYSDQKAYFSNWGQRLDVAAPGVDVLSLRGANTVINGTPLGSNPDYAYASGTSMAAPHVAGLAALVLAEHPTYSPEEVRQVLRSTATDLGTTGFDVFYGYGRVDAARAVSAGPVLEARILSPDNGSTAVPSITVMGVAQGNTFASYTLDYSAAGTPTQWTVLASSNTPVNHAQLGLFKTGTLTKGNYILRLRAFNTNGIAFEDCLQIIVKYDFISSPPTPAVPSTTYVYKPGASIPITGAASAQDFQRFRVEWAPGLNPTSNWSGNGMVQAGGGAVPVTNALLATWNSGVVTSGTGNYYTIRLTVEKATLTNQVSTSVYLEPDLCSTNWPYSFPVGTDGSLLPARDPQGHTRLVLMNAYHFGPGTGAPQLWSFAADGSDLQTCPLNFGNYDQLAVADFNPAAGQELVVADDTQIRVFPAVPTSTLATFSTTSASLRVCPTTLADLTGDGVPEVLALTMGLYGQSNQLYAWKTDGTAASSNFPVWVSGAEDILIISSANRVLAVDLDGDGRSEIIVAVGTDTNFTLKQYQADGSPGSWPALTFSGWFRGLAAGDFNHDGQPEILVGYSGSNFSNNRLVLLSASGTVMPGWPVDLINSGYLYLAAADLDNDGTDEIIASDGPSLHVLRGNGSPFSPEWPWTGNYLQNVGPVAVADIDGDGFPEIVACRFDLLYYNSAGISGRGPAGTSPAGTPVIPGRRVPNPGPRPENRASPRVDIALPTPAGGSAADAYYTAPQLVAFRRDATIAKSWNLWGRNGDQPYYSYLSAPVIGDFDNNGTVDIAVDYPTILGGGTSGYLADDQMMVLSLNAPYHPGAHDWPMLYHDPQNTACATLPIITRSLTVRSLNPDSGVPTTVSPADTNGLADGLTGFTRTYRRGAVVTLTEPMTSGAYRFSRWLQDNVTFTNQVTAMVRMDTNHILTSVYVPTNDQCSSAIALQPGITATINTLTATNKGDPVPGCGYGVNRSVWFSFTPAQNGPVTIHTCGSELDTVLQVYQGGCGALVPLAGNDDNGPWCPGLQASVEFPAVAATTYLVLAGGCDDAGGNLSVTAELQGTRPQFDHLSLTNGLFQSALLGRGGLQYAIQTSTNLLSWQPLTTVTIPAPGSLLISEVATDQPVRFYRAKRANEAPAARITAAPTSGPAPLSVTFTSAGSYDPDGSSLTWTWNFGDGTVSKLPNPNHVYASAGTFSAVLTVSDGIDMATATAIITVTNSPPP